MERTFSFLSALAVSMFLLASFAAIVSYDGNNTERTEDITLGSSGTPSYAWYGDGTATTFTINDADGLAGLAMIVNNKAPSGTVADPETRDSFSGKTISLADDIDLSVYDRRSNGGKGWMPIGTAAYSFKGTFDGNGKNITGLYINDAALYHTGLFGYVDGGTVRDLRVEGANITGKEYVGGIVGTGRNSEVMNCYSEGVISGSRYLGGITGFISGLGGVTNCYSAGEVIGTSNWVGGITGYVGDRSIVAGCYSTADISGDKNVGGIAGAASNGHVRECAALNPAVNGKNYIGRTAGYIDGFGTCIDNLAFSDISLMSVETYGDNGSSITSSEILSDGTIGGLFTTADGWTVEDGRLPGLFGRTEMMPEHILASGSSGSLPIIIIIGVIAVLAVSGAAVYMFVTRKK